MKKSRLGKNWQCYNKKMKVKVIFTLFFLWITLLAYVGKAGAVSDPLTKPNNFYGIHILFPAELQDASKLVNSSGGEWGYVTIPIQVNDLDIEKWQAFMDQAKRLKIIPILRLATYPNPFKTDVWRKPNNYDVVDFANFLSSLSWPTKIKYVILFNEVNRSDEWGGEVPDPEGYAHLVSFAYDTFKKKDSDFYIILSGMDDSAPNDYKKYINGFTYLEDLTSLDIQKSIDGFSSHSYPNPGFSSYPSETKKIGVATYKYEYELLNNNSEKKLPAFITETGWGSKTIPDSVVSKYFQMTFSQIWEKDKDKIVAITPFLLTASGPFDVFSLIANGHEKDSYKGILQLAKTKGNPEVEKNRTTSEIKPIVSRIANFTPKTKKKANAAQNLISLYIEKIFGFSCDTIVHQC